MKIVILKILQLCCIGEQVKSLADCKWQLIKANEPPYRTDYQKNYFSSAFFYKIKLTKSDQFLCFFFLKNLSFKKVFILKGVLYPLKSIHFRVDNACDADEYSG